LMDKSGDVYFKVSGLDKIAPIAESTVGVKDNSLTSSSIDKFVQKVDGTWIKISSEDLKSFSSSYADSKTCLNSTLAKYKNDLGAMNEVADLYNKNQFITVYKNLGQKNGSLGYTLRTNNVTAQSFAKGFVNTKIYKTLHDCDSSFTISDSFVNANISETTNNDGDFNLWVSEWSHQITKIEFAKTDKTSTINAVILPTYNQLVTITTPQTSIGLNELQAYATDVYNSYVKDATANSASL
jgi:hypothetical protein